MEPRLPGIEIAEPPPPWGRWKLAAAALVFTVVAVYGSFVPMEFKPLAWEQAVEQFKAIPFLDLGLYKRADLVANILLFVPLGFLWLGAIDVDRRRRTAALLAAPFIAMVLIALALAVEFAQQWTVRRTVSQNDIIAESVGAVLGMVLWLLAGRWLMRRMREVAAAGEPVATSAQQTVAFVRRLRRFLLFYAIGLVLYNVQPLDIAISAEAIRQKMDDGRVILKPFARMRGNPINGLWQAASDVVLFIPIGVLLRLGRLGLRGMITASLLALAAAAAVELAQLFIFSRIVDTTDVITSTIGGVLGALLAGWLVRPRDSDASPRGVTALRLLASAGLCIAYAIPLLIVFWHPHRLVSSMADFRAKLRGLWVLPFSSHYFGSEFNALVDVVRGVIYFVPFGALWRWAWRGSDRLLWPGRLLVLITSTALAALIEVGQAAVVGRYADITDLCLNVAGAGLGWWVWGLVFCRPPVIERPVPRGVVPEWN